MKHVPNDCSSEVCTTCSVSQTQFHSGWIFLQFYTTVQSCIRGSFLMTGEQIASKCMYGLHNRAIYKYKESSSRAQLNCNV